MSHFNIFEMSLRLKPLRFLQQTNALHKVCKCGTATSSSRASEAIFLEKTLEDPIIAVTDRDNVDMIGPPDPVSNLRPIVRKICSNETTLQEKLRLMQNETHNWNQTFWADHNTRFIKQKKDYIQKKQEEMNETRALTADELSEFYKEFLDSNWNMHVNYNLQWYKRNFTLMFLALRASLPQGFH
ncbi:PREDICTED: APOPT family protein Y39B6A.34, mitochondrial [Nicrophorus vespilloides]|uniref:APOPT family protein Y39B6A.34, mitochondrial n=1 Tax=Nicrophorus vespilloides TaxID=110193 RepID=A0ABM1M5R0_NICVS|nr:PREDICTED: APOPT family protein Y39B6A.34, mitochondrial [Nicrophorus vespilloides]